MGAQMGADLSTSFIYGGAGHAGTGAADQENRLWMERQRRDQSRENHIEEVCKRRSMGGLLAKEDECHRQCRHRHWKLQVLFTKFGTITNFSMLNARDDPKGIMDYYLLCNRRNSV